MQIWAGNLQLGMWPDLLLLWMNQKHPHLRWINYWSTCGRTIGVNGSQRMEWESCQLQWFPTAEAEGWEETSFFNVSGIQCSSHNMICTENISYLPPITKLTQMLTLSSYCISVSPKGQATAWKLSPWCYSHKQVQSATCMHFQDSGLWTLLKKETS